MTHSDWEKVKDTDWDSLHPELADRELFVHREREFEEGKSLFPHYTNARENGTCPFFIDNRCFIHGYLGRENKPRMCRLFPYTFVSTPTGIYVGLMYGSNAAVRNMGQLLSDQRPILEEMWRASVDHGLEMTKVATDVLAKIDSVSTGENVVAEEFTVALSSGLTITWTEYLELEERLIRLFRSDQIANFCYLFLSGGEIIVEAIRMKRAGEDWSGLKSFEPITDEWLGNAPSLVENRLFYVLCFSNFVWPGFRRQYQDLQRGKDKNPLTNHKIIGSVMRAVLFKEIDLPQIGKIRLDKCLGMPINALSSEVNDFLRRYVYLRLFSKTYFGSAFCGLSVLSGYNTMVASFLCAMIFAKSYAFARGVRSVAVADFYEAYALLDDEMVALSQLPGDRSAFYDIGFSSPRLFNRLRGSMAVSIGAYEDCPVQNVHF